MSAPIPPGRKVVPIRWRDMDGFDHVNNAVYLNYLEEGRDAWLTHAVEGSGVTFNDFVVRHVSIDFVSALTQDDGAAVVEVRLPEQLAGLAPAGPFDLVIDATGVLTIEGQGPEKSLKAVDALLLDRYFRINASGPLLLLKALEPHLAPVAPCYAKLSARVGSITDNRLGGWYGYRASKAALNMLLQTAAIER